MYIKGECNSQTPYGFRSKISLKPHYKSPRIASRVKRHSSIMRPRLIAFLLSLNLSLVTSDSERLHAHLFSRSDICTENNSVDCDFSCMPLGSVCCKDGSGTFCPSGTVCDSDGCCPIGKRCTGPGGTMTYDVLTGTGSLPTSPPKNYWTWRSGVSPGYGCGSCWLGSWLGAFCAASDGWPVDTWIMGGFRSEPVRWTRRFGCE